MIHFLIHDVLFNFVFIGFVVWKAGRMWLYPNMDKALDHESKTIRVKILRFIVIWRHFRDGHETRQVLDCQSKDCVRL